MKHDGNQFSLTSDMQSSPATMAHTGEAAPDWDAHYGKSFRFAETPRGAATVNGKSVDAAPGTVSLVTPYNGDAWHSWPEASNEAKTNFKSNWGNMWDSAGGYKQRQILGAING